MQRLSLGQPTLGEFLAWKEHPVSLWVFKALQESSDRQKAQWEAQSWGEGTANPLLLLELRTRADAYEAVEATEYDAFCVMNGHDPAAGEEKA